MGAAELLERLFCPRDRHCVAVRHSGRVRESLVWHHGLAGVAPRFFEVSESWDLEICAGFHLSGVVSTMESGVAGSMFALDGATGA